VAAQIGALVDSPANHRPQRVTALELALRAVAIRTGR
jgi:hypothetical protein